MFEFVNFEMIIIRVVFGLTNTVEYLYFGMTQTLYVSKSKISMVNIILNINNFLHNSK